MSDELYHHGDGQRWHVYDVIDGRSRLGWRRLPLGSADAKWRVFVSATGERRFCAFSGGHPRGITDDELAACFDGCTGIQQADMPYMVPYGLAERSR